MENNNKQYQKIGAFWKKTHKSRTILNGQITWRGEKIKIVAFENAYKNKKTQPDFNILYSNEEYHKNYHDNNFNNSDEVPF